MTTKINSVAVEKKRILDETFNKKRLPSLLSEIKFSIDPSLPSKELLKKLTFAIKRKFKKDYFNPKPNERFKYLNSIFTCILDNFLQKLYIAQSCAFME